MIIYEREIKIANLYAKNSSNADEVKNPQKAKVEVVKLGNVNA